jgi:uncharacterized protein (DUF1501 family)
MKWSRRDVLRAGGLSALGLGMHANLPYILQNRLFAADPAFANKKLVFIFLRGGNDGVNTVIPHGDPEYSPEPNRRPTLYIPEAQALDLGNGFASLHPRMAPMMEIYDSAALTGVDGPGNLAVIHRIGYSGQSQSHFDSQQYWENGTPGDVQEEGMLYRQVAELVDLRSESFAAVSLSGSQMVALKGPLPIPSIRRTTEFGFNVPQSRAAKFLGSLPQPNGSGGTGILGAFGGPRDFREKPYRDLVYGTGLALTDAMTTVREAVAQGPYVPENGAVYFGSLGEKLTEIAMLLKRTPVRVVGANIGGFDTHVEQGAINGSHGDLLYEIARGFQALHRDLQEQWEDLIIVTMTEFGRTSIENGSFGTDHAHAVCMFVAGGGVKGGVYNCDATTWRPGDLLSKDGRYLERRTDYRAVFAEIFSGHFGDDAETIERVIPGYGQAAARSPADFRPLGFMAT